MTSSEIVLVSRTDGDWNGKFIALIFNFTTWYRTLRTLVTYFLKISNPFVFLSWLRSNVQHQDNKHEKGAD